MMTWSVVYLIECRRILQDVKLLCFADLSRFTSTRKNCVYFLTALMINWFKRFFGIYLLSWPIIHFLLSHYSNAVPTVRHNTIKELFCRILSRRGQYFCIVALNIGYYLHLKNDFNAVRSVWRKFIVDTERNSPSPVTVLFTLTTYVCHCRRHPPRSLQLFPLLPSRMTIKYF